jgi:hypothetical protein
MTITPHGSPAFKPNQYWVNPKPESLRAQSCGHGTYSW